MSLEEPKPPERKERLRDQLLDDAVATDVCVARVLDVAFDLAADAARNALAVADGAVTVANSAVEVGGAVIETATSATSMVTETAIEVAGKIVSGTLESL